ncbi:hypothetical protein ABHI18_011271, partial [Aspergillus niger]
MTNMLSPTTIKFSVPAKSTIRDLSCGLVEGGGAVGLLVRRASTYASCV